jgi:nucleotide-binding universal stress UspA family protein
MAYANLMVHLELGQSNARLLRITADLAQRFDCGVTGIVACQPMPMVYTDGFVPAALFEQDSEIIAKQMNEAEAEFRNELRARADRLDWRHSVMPGSLADYIASEARHADLIVTGVVSKDLFDASRSVNTGDLIMQAGRPVLVVPGTTEQLRLERVVVGWKDSRETRRAIVDALPLLKRASSVSVAEIAGEEAMPDARAHVADVVGWLQSHGIVAQPVTSPSTGDDATGLYTIAQDLGADVIVAGAYGYSQLREWVMGGVTRDFLLRAGCCSLLSH